MKILLIGADGQLGVDLAKVLSKEELISLTISDLDITKKEPVFEILKKYKPAIVINTAAFNDTKLAEEEPYKAFDVNVLGVKYLADACKSIDATLVHISTDYVFDGKSKKPYTEEDLPSPLNAYGISKLAGEGCVKPGLEKYFIIRTSGLYGTAGCLGKGGTNFVENMLKRAQEDKPIKIVTDEILTPTYSLDLAHKIAELIKTKHYGLYHITNNGQCSWYEFAKEIFKLAGIKIEIKPALSKEFKSKIERPKYSVLTNANLQKLGLDDLRPWNKALEAYLKERKSK